MVKINLLPIRSELRKKALIEHIALLGLCVVLIVILSVFVQTSITSKRDMLLQEMTNTKLEIARLTVLAGDIEKIKKQKQELEKKLDVIKELNAKKTGPVAILDQLSLIIPEKAWIVSLNNSGNNITLDGVAIDNPTIAAFMKSLQASPYFQGVELVLTQKEASNTKFTIKCQIKLPS